MPRDYKEGRVDVQLNHKEARDLNNFVKHHSKCKGTLFKLKCTSTGGIGVVTYVLCEDCKKQEDITDYGSW